MVEKVVR